MDFSTFEVTDDVVATMTVFDPRNRAKPLTYGEGDDKKPITISFVGMDSPRAREASRKARVRALLDRGAMVSADVEEATTAMRKAEERDLETLVTVTVGWSGIGIDAEETPFSTDACRKAYQRCPWLVEQVNMFLGNRANFMKASRKN